MSIVQYRKATGTGIERDAIVFVSPSIDDARALRQIVDPAGWMVVNVPDLTGARAVIDRLRPALVICDTEIEGKGSWRDLLEYRRQSPGWELAVASRLPDDPLWAEVLNLGGVDLLERPFSAHAVEQLVARHQPAAHL